MDDSSENVKILMSKITMERLEDQFTTMFKCLVNVSRPDKKGIVKLSKAELLWEKKTDSVFNPNSVIDNTLLDDFLNMMKDTTVTSDERPEPEQEPEITEQPFSASIDFEEEEEDESSSEVYVPAVVLSPYFEDGSPF